MHVHPLVHLSKHCFMQGLVRGDGGGSKMDVTSDPPHLSIST